MTVFGSRVFTNVIKLITGHTKLGRALIPYDWCPPKKRRRPTDTERRQLCEDGDKEWSYADTNQGMPGATRS